LPHRGSVHRIIVPVEVVTLAAVPLHLALDVDAVILTRASALEFRPQIRRSECATGECECATDGTGTLPRWFTCPLCEVAC
jgi:hypothetical protein